MADDDELTHLREENMRLAQELVETNRGVVALYAELEDKAEHSARHRSSSRASCRT